MYRLKTIPGDFIVDEIPLDFNIKKSGSYYLIKLSKTHLSTQQAVEFLSYSFNIPLRFFNYAGLKDKVAVTSQFVTVKNIKKIDFSIIRNENIKIDHLGFTDERLNLGSLKGNNFTITVRNITNSPEPIQYFPNLFGEQRFSKNNVEVGLNIIKGNFEEVVGLILKNDNFYKNKIEEFLETSKNNYVGALSLIPLRILKIYVHAFQSSLWNGIALDYIKSKKADKNSISTLQDIKMPLIGFSTELDNYEPEIRDFTNKLLKDNNITYRDFIIRKMPKLSSEGDERRLITKATDLLISDFKEDDLNPGKKKLKLQFSLSKGSYATVFIDYLLS